ncbi:MAG TPA: protein-L-isoaspartate(D-aspartate) O-methyltransferase [Chloroflexota bacterium]|jgi:protein-L-isoaspartate(D-aspartate) O-methyltransferase|nr:protein-L-isoaspartate(D-aspartate) O-methyltransferase [Chloroflexota bacterium]
MPTLNELLAELQTEGVSEQRVLDAMSRVDRARFVPEVSRDNAYDNTPLSIGQGQTISQPLVVGLMTQALAVEPAHKVLEVGTGSGYQTAILAELAGQVFTLERHKRLADAAESVLHELGYSNVEVRTGSGSAGWPAYAPYDRILVTAAAPRIPIHLVAQLARGGRLVVPVGSRAEQQLVVVDKTESGIAERSLGAVRFVPLVGEDAWPDDPA